MRRRLGVEVAATLVGGAVVGVAWWALAPTAHVGRLDDGTLLSLAHQELDAAQDGWLVVLLALLGLAAGLVAARRPTGAPLLRSLGVLVVGLAATAVAVAVGRLLGPAGVHAQLARHPHGPVTSPLRLHSPAGWLVEPLVAASVMTIGHLVAARRGDGAAPADDGAPAEGGEELAVQPGRTGPG